MRVYSCLSDFFWVPGKLQEKVKTFEEELVRKDEALDDAQHQLQERGNGKIVVHDGGLIRSMMQVVAQN